MIVFTCICKTLLLLLVEAFDRGVRVTVRVRVCARVSVRVRVRVCCDMHPHHSAPWVLRNAATFLKLSLVANCSAVSFLLRVTRHMLHAVCVNMLRCEHVQFVSVELTHCER